MENIDNQIVTILILLWLIVLFLRSCLYIVRIYGENSKPNEVYYKDVYICGPEPQGKEKLWYYNYINEGVECEK
jgi:NADH:ubiquinone oxidoreductase subunit 3 (subunit A)